MTLRHRRTLSDGVDFAVLAMGMFGFAEILRNLESPETRDVVRRRDRPADADDGGYQAVLPPDPSRHGRGRDPRASCPATARCSGRSRPTPWRRSSPRIRRRFGRGAIEGVAGPESANNAGAQTSFIPLLTLGIPPNAVMALMVGAMTIHGIIPGPQVMTKNPRPVLGHGRVHVDRQPDAADHQPAAGRRLGEAAARCPTA